MQFSRFLNKVFRQDKTKAPYFRNPFFFCLPAGNTFGMIQKFTKDHLLFVIATKSKQKRLDKMMLPRALSNRVIN